MPSYDVFISYSRAADGELAPALQRGLRRLAKPFYRRAALRVFRDRTGLAIEESLWGAIVRALDASRHFVLLASPASARSAWVRREVRHWLAAPRERPPLVVLTEGEVAWDGAAQDFDWGRTDALPRELAGAYADEPLWLDLRWARNEEQVSLRHPGFRDAVADLAATLHGVSKDQIAGRDIREHRRTMAAVWSAVTGLVVLTLLAVAAAYVAHRNEQRALSRLLAAQAASVLEERRFDLALLLAAEALARHDTTEARSALINAVQGQPRLVTWLHGAGKVRHLAFSPSGSLLASASSDRRVRLWDVADHRLLGPPLAAPDEATPRGLAFSPDGQSLAVTTAGGVRLWDLTSDAPARQGPPGPAPAWVARSEAIDPRAQGLLDRLEQRPRRFAVDPAGRRLATADGHAVQVRSLTSGEPLGAPLSAQAPYVRALAFSAGGGLLASGSSDGTIALWDLDAPPLMGRRLKGHATSTNAVAFSPEGRYLASAGYSGEVALWEVPSGSRRAGPTPPTGARVIRFHRDGTALLSHGAQTVRWGVPALERMASAPAVPRGAAAAVAPDLAGVAIGTNAGEVSLWDVAGGARLWASAEGHSNRLLALAFSPGGERLASAGNDRTVVVWDAVTGTRLGGPLQGHGRAIADLDFTRQGAWLASYDSHGTLRVWDVDSGEPVARALQRDDDYAGSSAMALAPDGRLAATSGDGGAIRLWDVTSARPLGQPLEGHPGDVVAMAIGPRGRWLASGGLGGALVLWDLRPASWARRACTMANRDLTAQEKVLYLGREAGDDAPGVCAAGKWGLRRRFVARQ